MKNAYVIEPNDIKEILSKYFKVPPEKVIKSQYSYTVVLDDVMPEEHEKEELE